jgi:acyl-coenzyme A synthetase/AMP-(fatty) acid ligase
MWNQKIDYIDVEPCPAPPVKKHVWDGEKFVPMTMHKKKGSLTQEQKQWLHKVAGRNGSYTRGTYWDYSVTGDYTVMDEKLYVWYQMKWGSA